MPKSSTPFNVFIIRFKERSKNEYEYISGYTRMSKKIKVKHLKCGSEFEVVASAFINTKTKCKECSTKIIGEKNFQNNLAAKDYKKLVSERTNGEYELMSEYKGFKESVEIKHLICEKTYKTKYKNFARGNRCPYCK